jgi:acetolactate synthase small subunit
MISKITQGNNFVGLKNYLMGPGKHNEHINQKIIYSKNIYTDNFASEMKLWADLKSGREVKKKVWHCVLSLPLGEQLTDDKWQNVIKDYLDKMGLTDNQAVAIYHGNNNNGNQHIHIMVNKVNADCRTIWDNKNERYKSNKICKTLEIKYDLQRENHSKKDVLNNKIKRENQLSNIENLKTNVLNYSEKIKIYKGFREQIESYGCKEFKQKYLKAQEPFAPGDFIINRFETVKFELLPHIENKYNKLKIVTNLKEVLNNEIDYFLTFYLNQKNNSNQELNELEKQPLPQVRKQSPKQVRYKQVQQWKNDRAKEQQIKQLKLQQERENKRQRQLLEAEKKRWNSLTPEQKQAEIKAKKQRQRQFLELSRRNRQNNNNNRGLHL